MRKVDRALRAMSQVAGRSPLGSKPASRTLKPLPTAVRSVVQSPRSAVQKVTETPVALRKPMGTHDARVKQTRRGVYKVEGYSYRDDRQRNHNLIAVQGAGSAEHLGQWQLHRGKPEGSKTLLHTAETLESLRSDVARGRVRSVSKGYGGRTSRLAGKEKPAKGTP